MFNFRQIFISILILHVLNVQGTHIVGGELNYSYKGNNKYRILLKLYVDCVNGQPGAIAQDITARIGVFSKTNDSLLNSLCFEIKRKNPIRVSKTNYNCIKISPNACVDAYEYDTVITLPKRLGGYVLSFQRCCRNNTILNLVNPESTGENLWTVINDFDSIGINNSPYFKNLPANFLCTNAPLIFDHSATDEDGDSLVYDFFHPFTGANANDPRPIFNNFEQPPFSQVVFSGSYTFFDAINSNPSVSINRNTGLLKITPTVQGQFVVGIIVREYRNGKLIGFTQRDYQFNVQNCVFETTSAFTTPDINCDKRVIFNNTSQNANKFFWDFGDSTVSNDTSNLQIGTYIYPKIGNYTVKLIASNGNCADTIFKTITIYDKIYFNLPKDTLLCRNEKLIIRPDTFYNLTNYEWSNGSRDTFIEISSPGIYWLKLQRINCLAYDSMVVQYDTTKIELLTDSLICDIKTMKYTGKVFVKGNYNSINWSSDPNQVPNQFNGNSLYINKDGWFKIEGLNSNNCPYKEEVSTIKKGSNLEFKLYNVFTPNGDGLNDVYPEENPNYLYEVQIFNRWGIEVYKGENVAWTGENFPDGVYYYLIKIKTCSVEESYNGVVHLIK